MVEFPNQVILSNQGVMYLFGIFLVITVLLKLTPEAWKGEISWGWVILCAYICTTIIATIYSGVIYTEYYLAFPGGEHKLTNVIGFMWILVFIFTFVLYISKMASLLKSIENVNNGIVGDTEMKWIEFAGWLKKAFKL